MSDHRSILRQTVRPRTVRVRVPSGGDQMLVDLGTFLILGCGAFLVLLAIGWGFDKLEEGD